MSKVLLVTGCAGFIGMHAALYAKRRGDKVIGLDHFNDYYAIKLKRDREKILKDNGIDVIDCDVCDQKKLEQIIEEHKITHFLHLAAQAGVRYSLENPNAYLHSNVNGFTSVLEAIRKFPHIPLIYASSSSVYGTNDKLPFSVDDTTDHPANFYGATKKANEVMAYSYHHLFKIKVTGLRFFTVYGPWGRPDMAYYSFAEAIKKGIPINVFNNGNMSRDFTYIDDIVEGTLSAVDHAYDCELFNLGDNDPQDLGTMIEYIENALNKKAIINYLPMQQGDMLSTYADISHSQLKLKFQPKTPLKDGINQFIEWFKNYE
ncbi:MAG: NAD-dependent epimerase/dehydratase family protein [Parachlamydiales bacterium]|nr:NAD-dependent epimerase/dehydratase family protein [Parachlamydiales bacterium]